MKKLMRYGLVLIGMSISALCFAAYDAPCPCQIGKPCQLSNGARCMHQHLAAYYPYGVHPYQAYPYHYPYSFQPYQAYPEHYQAYQYHPDLYPQSPYTPVYNYPYQYPASPYYNPHHLFPYQPYQTYHPDLYQRRSYEYEP